MRSAAGEVGKDEEDHLIRTGQEKSEASRQMSERKLG